MKFKSAQKIRPELLTGSSKRHPAAMGGGSVFMPMFLHCICHIRCHCPAQLASWSGRRVCEASAALSLVSPTQNISTGLAVVGVIVIARSIRLVRDEDTRSQFLNSLSVPIINWHILSFTFEKALTSPARYQDSTSPFLVVFFFWNKHIRDCSIDKK